jgi:hypothetical protein
MNILFLTTNSLDSQGDYLELTILIGLKELCGDRIIDFPKKKIIYGDFSLSEKNKLHGKGFTLLSKPLLDNFKENSISSLGKIDAIIIGCGHQYGESFDVSELKTISDNIWVLDGHDLYGNAKRKINYRGEELIGIQFFRSFKRELVEPYFQSAEVYPTGFGIPISQIREINLSNKVQLFQSTAPDSSLFKTQNDLGGINHHKFSNEEEYFNDISISWFGLSCKKGGWDCLRHYEILACGTLLLFRDYDEKPKYCSPQFLPCISYSSKEELFEIINKLLPNGVPSLEYFKLLKKQREWLLSHGTTKARAEFVLNVVNSNGELKFDDLNYFNYFVDYKFKIIVSLKKFLINPLKIFLFSFYKYLFK